MLAVLKKSIIISTVSMHSRQCRCPLFATDPEAAGALNSTFRLVPVTLRTAYDCCQVTAFRFKAWTNKETKSLAQVRAIQAEASKSRRKHTLRQSVEEIRLEEE